MTKYLLFGSAHVSNDSKSIIQREGTNLRLAMSTVF